jgi:hypothetical protein
LNKKFHDGRVKIKKLFEFAVNLIEVEDLGELNRGVELIAKVAMGRVAFFRGAWQGAREGVMPQCILTEGATPPGASEKATRRAGVLLPCGFVARASRSCGYAPYSTPRRKAKSLPARPVSTFAMSSRGRHIVAGSVCQV